MVEIMKAPVTLTLLTQYASTCLTERRGERNRWTEKQARATRIARA
jgi:hypothetical protein